MLTETDIKALKPHPTRHRWVNDGDGLYLRVSPTDRRSWVWRTKRNGKTSYFTLGEWPDLTVKQARAALAKRTGRATAPNALTVSDALEDWFADQIQGKYRVSRNARIYVNRACAEFGRQRLQELTRAQLARFVKGYAKSAPVAANRCLSTLKLALGWCVESGYLEHSPAEGLTRRIAGGDESTRSRVLSDAEIRALWNLDSPNAPLLRALLLTGCRIAELQKATISHLMTGSLEAGSLKPDPDGEWLLIPVANSKNAKAHHVYLVPEIRKEFSGKTRIFSSVSPTAVQAFLRRMQEDENGPREPWASLRPLDSDTGTPLPSWTPHDLRRTYATRLGGLGVAPHVIEKLLNHTAGGVAAIYNRAPLEAERIAATKLWAAELERIVRRKSGG